MELTAKDKIKIISDRRNMTLTQLAAALDCTFNATFKMNDTGEGAELQKFLYDKCIQGIAL